MSQSQVMVGALIAGFFIWLLMNNGLAKYWALLTGGGAVSPSVPSTANTPTPNPGAGSPGTTITPQSSTGPGAPGGITINPGPTSAGDPGFFGLPQSTTPGG